MFRSSWSNVTKTGLAIGAPVALGSAALLAWSHSVSTEYERQADYHAHQYATYAAGKIAESCNILASVEKGQCLAEASAKAREYERDEQDLVAQKQSAFWAYVMAIAAVVGVALSVIGVLLVWTTFRETKRANAIAREAMEAQTRPWLKLSVRPTHVEKEPKEIRVNIKVETTNVGNAPANYVSLVPVILDGYWSTPRILNAVPNLFSDDGEPKNLHDKILFQNENWEYKCTAEATNFPENETTACMVVSIRYNSPSDPKPHYTTVIFDLVHLNDALEIDAVEHGDLFTLVERQSFSAYAD